MSESPYDPVLDPIARRCARVVRGCATDEQYTELMERIIAALRPMAEAAAFLDRMADSINRMRDLSNPDAAMREAAADCRAEAASLRKGGGSPVAVQAQEPAREEREAEQDHGGSDR